MNYMPNLQHRNQSYAMKKSQWSISIQEENECFNNANDQEWFFKNSLWGVQFIPDNNPPLKILGAAPPPVSCELKMAKFVCDSHDNWHGYPVAHWMSPYDRPGESVLKDWCEKGIISKANFARIRRGKKCAL